MRLLIWAFVTVGAVSCARRQSPVPAPPDDHDPDTVMQRDSSSASPEPAATGLVVTLEGSRAGPTHVRVTVSNPSPKKLEFCRYHTPFEGIANKIFVVTSADGSEVPYRGKMKKRAPPTRADYVSIRPGASESTEVDLASAYALPPGEYRVHFRGGGISGLPDSTAMTLVVP